jgi:acetate kinase
MYVFEKLIYILVVDAGSSHTKLNVFHYRGDKINGTGKIEQLQLTECNGTLEILMFIIGRRVTE